MGLHKVRVSGKPYKVGVRFAPSATAGEKDDA